MLLKEKVGDDEYVLDTSKLKDIEFPFYTPYNRSAYYVPSDKSVYLPIKFGFDKGTKKDTGKICAKMPLPDGEEIKAQIEIALEDIMAAMVSALQEGESLFHKAEIARCMKVLAESVYRTAQQQDDDIVMQSCEHTFPTFLFQRNNLIAVSDASLWTVEDEHLVVTMQKSAGTFLRAFKSDEDRQVSIIALDSDGNQKIASLGTVVSVHGNEIRIRKEKNKYPSSITIRSCEEIYKKYKNNYMNYFLDKEEEERGEGTFEFESIFKEDL